MVVVWNNGYLHYAFKLGGLYMFDDHFPVVKEMINDTQKPNFCSFVITKKTYIEENMKG
jgi:hypothetical protein